MGHAALHQVDEAAGCGHNDLCAALEGTYLALDARTAVDSLYVQAVDVAGIVLEVVGYLEAKLARGAEDDGLRGTALGIDFLEHGQAVGRRFSRTGLGQCYHIVAHTEQVGDDFFLYRHGMVVAHFGDGATDFLAHAQFFKCLQVIYN